MSTWLLGVAKLGQAWQGTWQGSVTRGKARGKARPSVARQSEVPRFQGGSLADSPRFPGTADVEVVRLTTSTSACQRPTKRCETGCWELCCETFSHATSTL